MIFKIFRNNRSESSMNAAEYFFRHSDSGEKKRLIGHIIKEVEEEQREMVAKAKKKFKLAK